MSSWSGSYFEYFNLESLESTRDTGLAHIEDRILFRVKRLLSSRTKKEIDELVLIIDAIVSDFFDSTKALDRIIADTEGGPSLECRINEDAHGITAAEYLSMMAGVDLSDLSHTLHPNWNEVFSLLALNLVGEAAAEDAYQQSKNNNNEYKQSYLRGNHAAHYLFDACEILHIAERLTESPGFVSAGVDAVAGRQISIRNGLAAKRKHAPIQKIKDMFIKWFLEHSNDGTFKSRSDAARKFYSNLEADLRKLMAPTNAERTLKDALREFEKSKS